MGSIQEHLRSFIDAIKILQDRDEPEDLISWANRVSDSPMIPLTEDDLVKLLDISEPADRIKIFLGDLIMSYDRFPDDSKSWCEKTVAFTQERRDLSVRFLGLTDKSADLISKFRPIPLSADRPTVVGDPEGYSRWYVPSRIDGRDFYWRNYREHLAKKRGFSSNSLARLDISSSEIVSRLSDPTSVNPYSTRGIVVGYVQSGKTQTLLL